MTASFDFLANLDDLSAKAFVANTLFSSTASERYNNMYIGSRVDELLIYFDSISQYFDIPYSKLQIQVLKMYILHV